MDEVRDWVVIEDVFSKNPHFIRECLLTVISVSLSPSTLVEAGWLLTMHSWTISSKVVMEDQVVRFMCGTEDSQLVHHVSRMSVQERQRASSHCGWHMNVEEDLIEPSLSTLVISVRDLQLDQLPDLLLVQHDQPLEEQLDEQQQWWCADQWDDASCSFVGILDAMEEISFNLSSFWHWFWDWISFYMENQNKVFLVFSEMLQYFHFIICILIFHLTEHKKYLAQLRNDTDIAPHKTGRDYGRSPL